MQSSSFAGAAAASEAVTEDEGPDPTEDLRMPVRLKPRRGEVTASMMLRDVAEIPGAQEDPRQEHEQPVNNPGGYRALQRGFVL
ncbi:MAG: hypothetical protein LAQ69_03490 [Acidobacteriia bacterium]|nr:hypothetical protein [Terriglobia bacterium]